MHRPSPSQARGKRRGVVTPPQRRLPRSSSPSPRRSNGGEVNAAARWAGTGVAGRLARATFEPGLMLTDASYAIEEIRSAATVDAVVQSCMPFRTIFDRVWSGKRHVVMGAPDRCMATRTSRPSAVTIASRRPAARHARRTRQPDQRHHLLDPQARSSSSRSMLSAAPATSDQLPCPRRPGGSTTFAGSSHDLGAYDIGPARHDAGGRCTRVSRSSRRRRHRRSNSP